MKYSLRLGTLYTLLVLCSFGLSAQTVTLDLPAHPGRQVSLCLLNGLQSDTIFNGMLDSKGQAVIAIPPAYKNYKGIAALRPVHPGAYFEFIIAGEGMTLHCPEEYPHGGNTTFSGSPENTFLQSRFMEQARRQQKTALLSEALPLYDREDAFQPVLEKQKQQLETEQAAFEKELTRSPLYAAKFIRFHNFLNREVATLAFADSLQMAQVRAYVRDSLDINGLFTSGMWFNTLNGLLALYDNGTPYHYEFVNDMAKLLAKADDKVYTALAENLFTICESTGWNDLEEQLAYFLINDGRIKNPTGKLQMLMTLFKLAKGSKVPGLSQGKLPEGKTLLVFYESGCGPCENEMQQLKGNYPLLKEKGYEVVTVAADMDADVFRNTAETFPWTQKYCDLQGFSGVDFKSFGVIGTPTFYVIDEKGVLLGRYAKLKDTGIL